MARVATMTVNEAEAAIGKPRGYLSVDSNNRGAVRKWFVAHGFPSLYVCGLAMRALQAAYNDTSNKTLDRMRKEANDAMLAANEAGEGIGGAAHGVNDPDALQAGQAAGNGQGNDADGNDAEGDGNGQQQGQGNGKDGNDDLSPLEREVIRVTEKHFNLKQGQDNQPAPRVIKVEMPERAAVDLEGYVAPQFERVLKLILAGANVLLVGPAGCGKTHMAEQIAKALGRDYGAIHGSAGASESALTGWLLPSDGGKFEYVPAPFVTLYGAGNSLFLLDELDAFDPNMLLVCNGALANGHLWIAHNRNQPCVKRGKDCAIVATANTYGTGANPMYSGRAPLDASTLDRFITVTVDYDKKLEKSLGEAAGLTADEMKAIWTLRDKVRESTLRRVISTRAFQKAGMMKAAGDSWPVVMATLVEGWTRDEKAKVGMA